MDLFGRILHTHIGHLLYATHNKVYYEARNSQGESESKVISRHLFPRKVPEFFIVQYKHNKPDAVFTGDYIKNSWKRTHPITLSSSTTSPK